MTLTILAAIVTFWVAVCFGLPLALQATAPKAVDKSRP